MSDDDEIIIKALEQSGFPFERKIKNKLSELDIETVQSRYFEQNQYGEVSKDLDVLGYIKSKTFKTKDNRLFPTLELELVGEVKKWSNSKICFYEFDEIAGNFPVSFPNFLNEYFSLSTFSGGYELLSNFLQKFGKISFSKTICFLESKFDKGNKHYKNNGNEPIYKTSNDLALACEYLHKKSIVCWDRAFKIHGCFPIIFTDAEIIKVSGIEKLVLDKVNHFIYLVACTDLDKVPLTTKEIYYLPILITNFDGIDSSINLSFPKKTSSF